MGHIKLVHLQQRGFCFSSEASHLGPESGFHGETLGCLDTEVVNRHYDSDQKEVVLDRD